MWHVIPSQRMYLEQSLSGAPESGLFGRGELSMTGPFEDIGEETVNGYLCQKQTLRGGDTSKGTVTRWFSPHLQAAVKTEFVTPSGGTEMMAEHRNIVEMKLPDNLFEIPAGYQQMIMPRIPGRRLGSTVQ